MEGFLNTDHSAVASIAVSACLQKLTNTIQLELQHYSLDNLDEASQEQCR